MKPPREPVFLARETYRRKRLMDAARFLPFLGIFLILAPILWAGRSPTTSGYVYLFGLWLVLIILAGVLSRRLAEVRDDEMIEDEDD